MRHNGVMLVKVDLQVAPSNSVTEVHLREELRPANRRHVLLAEAQIKERGREAGFNRDSLSDFHQKGRATVIL